MLRLLDRLAAQHERLKRTVLGLAVIFYFVVMSHTPCHASGGWSINCRHFVT
jgi:hypothetical protein